MSIINEFIQRYSREYDYYHEVARLCAQLCEFKLHSSGIRAIVTFRAKNIDRLKEKLIDRDKEKAYKNNNDIYADLVDLSGVRIALYFPNDQLLIDNIIKNNFLLIQSKNFPTESKSDKPNPIYTKRFSGYWATHYRVKLKPDGLSEVNRRYSDANIEIQVASVIMHAWAEVEHDLIYKPTQGNLSHDELSILDALNGLVISGEIALGNLQGAIKTRVNKLGTVFNNHYELAGFLADELKSKNPSDFKEFNLERVNLLFRFLQVAKLDTAASVKQYLEQVKEPYSDVISAITKKMIGEDTKLCKQFVKVQRETASKNNKNNIPVETEALYIAEGFGNVDLFQKLISEGADVNAGNFGSSVLASAIIHKQPQIITLLIANGANVNSYEEFFGTPLMLATLKDDIETAKLLLEKGADVNFKSSEGLTPLIIANTKKNEDLVKVLKDAGAL